MLVYVHACTQNEVLQMHIEADDFLLISNSQHWKTKQGIKK